MNAGDQHEQPRHAQRLEAAQHGRERRRGAQQRRAQRADRRLGRDARRRSPARPRARSRARASNASPPAAHERQQHAGEQHEREHDAHPPPEVDRPHARDRRVERRAPRRTRRTRASAPAAWRPRRPSPRAGRRSSRAGRAGATAAAGVAGDPGQLQRVVAEAAHALPAQASPRAADRAAGDGADQQRQPVAEREDAERAGESGEARGDALVLDAGEGVVGDRRVLLDRVQLALVEERLVAGDALQPVGRGRRVGRDARSRARRRPPARAR